MVCPLFSYSLSPFPNEKCIESPWAKCQNGRLIRAEKVRVIIFQINLLRIFLYLGIRGHLVQNQHYFDDVLGQYAKKIRLHVTSPTARYSDSPLLRHFVVR